jgi:flagellar biosynthesis chaperone FliJ
MVIAPYFRECVFDDELKNSFLKRNEKNTVTEILEDLKKFEILDDREQLKERVAEAVREQSEMDRIGLRMARA